MKLKEIWQKFGKAMAGAPPVNSMMSQSVAYIDKKVREQTEFSVGCQDTRMVNGRKNVGLIMAPTTAPEAVARAEDVFIAAAKERGIEIARENIVHYVPGTIHPPSRLVQPAPKTW